MHRPPSCMPRTTCQTCPWLDNPWPCGPRSNQDIGHNHWFAGLHWPFLRATYRERPHRQTINFCRRLYHRNLYLYVDPHRLGIALVGSAVCHGSSWYLERTFEDTGRACVQLGCSRGIEPWHPSPCRPPYWILQTPHVASGFVAPWS